MSILARGQRCVIVGGWLHGMSKDDAVKLTGKALKVMNVSRDAATDGLRRLEADGLVSVQRAKGKRPVVHIIHSKA